LRELKELLKAWVELANIKLREEHRPIREGKWKLDFVLYMNGIMVDCGAGE